MTTEREKIIQLARECGFRTGTVDFANGKGKQAFIEPIGTACTVELEAFYHKAQAEALTAAATALEAAIINGDIHLIKHCPDRLREMAKENGK